MITAERLRKLVNYCPKTGIFTWRITRPGHIHIGAIAGAPRGDGRNRIGLDKRRYMSSVLAVLWMTGSFPLEDEEVDHRNRNPSDDCWENLRVCKSQNNRWNVGLKTSNSSGFIGVHQRKNGRWLAYTRLSNGKRVYLGHYASAELAAEARDKVARQEHGSFAVINLEQ